MSDRELRQILRDVIEDMDTGRLARVGRALGRTAVVASLAVGSAVSCAAAPSNRSDARIVDVHFHTDYGAPFEASVDDASAIHDTGVTADASPTSDASDI